MNYIIFFALLGIVISLTAYLIFKIRIHRNDVKKQVTKWEDVSGDDLYQY